MSKLFKEAQSVKKVLSANTEMVAQVTDCWPAVCAITCLQIEGLFEDIDFSVDVC